MIIQRDDGNIFFGFTRCNIYVKAAEDFGKYLRGAKEQSVAENCLTK